MPKLYAEIQVDNHTDKHIVHFNSVRSRADAINNHLMAGITIVEIEASQLSKEAKAESINLSWGYEIDDKLKKASIIDFDIKRCDIEHKLTKHIDGVCQNCITRKKLLYINVLRDEFANDTLTEDSQSFAWYTKHPKDTVIVDLRSKELKVGMQALMNYIANAQSQTLKQDTFVIIDISMADNPLFKNKVINLNGFSNMGIYQLRWYYGDSIYEYINTSLPPHW